jgi:N-acetylneuraminic acid mutarotase
VASDGRIFLLGGHTGLALIKTTEVFVPGESIDSEGHWEELPPMQARRAYHSAAVVDGQIIVFGGSCDGRPLNNLEVYNLVLGTWSPWFFNTPSAVRRSYIAVAPIPGEELSGRPAQMDRLFVAGGFDGFRDLKSVEVCNLDTQFWERRDTMIQARSYHAMTVTRQGVFVIGGQDRNEPADEYNDLLDNPDAVSALAHVEFFDFAAEEWRECEPLDVPRQGPAAVTLGTSEDDELVYVCGGSDGVKALSSVVVLDTKTGKWSEAPPMNVPRLAHAAVALNGKVYVFGGHDGVSTLDTYEVFDPAEGRWGPPMKMGGSKAQAVADA